MIREALTFEQLRAMDPDEAAACYLARRAEGFTQSEEQLFSEWLEEDVAHARALQRAERAWNAFAQAGDHEILSALRAHALKLPQRSWANWQRLSAMAAVILLAIAASLLVLPGMNPLDRSSPEPGGQVGAPLEYASARGEIRTVTLPDGSIMTLDAGSRAAGNFSGSARLVNLRKGRAFFEVVPDRGRPFTVVAAGRRVTVVATRFDVDLAGGALTVTLVKGRVAVGPLDASAAPVMLEPGQQFVEQGGEARVRTIGKGAEDATKWRSGLLVFDDQSLAEAVAVMNRYSADRIVIRDPGVSRLRISGQFRATDGARFAETVSEMHRLRTVRRDGEIELAR